MMKFKGHIVYFLTMSLVCISLLMLTSSKEIESTREVTKEAQEVIKNLKHGDIILVSSDDLFSKVVRSVDNCVTSSFKVAIEYNDQIDLLVSDADSLVDNTQGLRAVPPLEYFQEYDTLRIKVLRPYTMDTFAENEIVKYLMRMSKEVVSYDFSFYKNDQTKLTCEKIVKTIYPYSFSEKHINNWYYSGYVPCDFQEDRFNVLTPKWVNYFVN